jgi:hypothetical protein
MGRALARASEGDERWYAMLRIGRRARPDHLDRVMLDALGSVLMAGRLGRIDARVGPIRAACSAGAGPRTQRRESSTSGKEQRFGSDEPAGRDPPHAGEAAETDHRG